MDERLSVACAVHDPALAEAYLLPSLDALEGEPPVRFVLDNVGNALSTNLAYLYNILLRLEGPPTRLLVHPDVTFEPDLTARLHAGLDALERHSLAWGAVGTVGRSWDGEYVWGKDVEEPVAVCTLDACCIVVDTRHELEFDERTFDGFHCHVEDYCLQAHASGRGVFVVPAHVEHRSVTYTREGSRWGAYPKYRKRLSRKWRRRFPTLTTT